MKVVGWRTYAGMAAALMPLIGVLVVSGCGSSAPSPPPAAVSPSQTTYVVKSGDTVYRVAARFGISTTALMSATISSESAMSSGVANLRSGMTLSPVSISSG